MIKIMKNSELVVNKSLMEEFVSCDLSVDALIDTKRCDYVVIEFVNVSCEFFCSCGCCKCT